MQPTGSHEPNRMTRGSQALFALAGHASALVTQAPGRALAETGVSPLSAGCTVTGTPTATATPGPTFKGFLPKLGTEP